MTLFLNTKIEKNYNVIMLLIATLHVPLLSFCLAKNKYNKIFQRKKAYQPIVLDAYL